MMGPLPVVQPVPFKQRPSGSQLRCTDDAIP